MISEIRRQVFWKPTSSLDFQVEGGLAIDATAPFAAEELYSQHKYPVRLVDLNKWLLEGEIAAMKARQSSYSRVLA